MDTGMGMKEDTIDEYPVTPRTQIVQCPALRAGLETPICVSLILEGLLKCILSGRRVGHISPILNSHTQYKRLFKHHGTFKQVVQLYTHIVAASFGNQRHIGQTVQ